MSRPRAAKTWRDRPLFFQQRVCERGWCGGVVITDFSSVASLSKRTVAQAFRPVLDDASSGPVRATEVMKHTTTLARRSLSRETIRKGLLLAPDGFPI
ncbi:MAG TPA: hypothetical protein VGL95_13690 [Acetobacteraceae bacterium]